MSVTDFRSVGAGGTLEADLCIIGSGPSGWAVAEELRFSGLSILMLESGGVERDAAADALNESEDFGIKLFNGRARVLGGTSSVWNGRAIPFDDIDYEARPWVPLSGWPVTPADVAPHLHRAAAHLGITPYRDRAGAAVALPGLRRQPDTNAALLERTYWSNPPIIDYGQRFQARTGANLRVFVNATVTHITTENGRASCVEVADAENKRSTVRARAIVLAAGGIENARILLYSNRQEPAGLGNAHDVVGRYFADHPRDFQLAAQVDPADTRRFRALVGPYLIDTPAGRCEYSHGFRLSSDYQRAAELLNCAAWPYDVPSEDDPFDAVKRLRAGPRRTVGDAWRVVRQPGLVLRGVHARAIAKQRVPRKPERIGFLVASEQRPDPDSRIRLSARCDRFGLPTTAVDWRVGEQEVRSQATLARLIASEFQRLGLPRIQLVDWARPGSTSEPVFADGCHPSGATRMSHDPRTGVVDADCQVHGVPGLFVAGSSVFPTSGHANPTLMIVALAVRLANHLKGVLSAAESRPPVALPPQAKPAPPPAIGQGTRVAVTGHTGFIGGRLIERLAGLGADIVCLTRQDAAKPPAGGRTVVLDLADAAATEGALRGVEAVFHCAFDWDDAHWNERAMRSLIAGCAADAVRRLVHVSSFVVYDLPDSGEVTEDLPATTACSGYPSIKLELEGVLLGAVRRGTLAATVIQPTIVYGPFCRPWTMEPADRLRFGTVVLPDGGSGICAAVNVEDVVTAMLLAADNPAAVGERFLVSGPGPVTWGEFYEALAAAAGARGPQYRRAVDMERDAQPMRRRLRRLADPEWAVRRAASIAPLRRVIHAAANVLPPGSRGALMDRLYRPENQRPGVVHLPSPAELRGLQGRAVVRSDKAHRILGYVPQVDLAAGMAAVASFLHPGNGGPAASQSPDPGPALARRA